MSDDEPSATAVDRTLTSPHADSRGAALGPGDRLHRYQLTALLGAGGMGVVYAADDAELHRKVAIKLLHHGDGAAAAERALGEARAMAQFRHANVVPVFDVGVHRGQVYLVMPLLEEGTLGDWLRAGPRPWRAVLERFVAAARGLNAAHAAGLVHRDFKPDNVLLGAGDEVRVADFGLALGDAAPFAPGPPGTTQTRLRGTPAYMAPEHLDGATVDARADQFSFCVALYAALYGQRPFAESDADPIDLVALREAIRAGRIRPTPRDRSVPRWLSAVVARGLRDDPAGRLPSMNALIGVIERGLGRSRRLVVAGSGIALSLGVAVVFASTVLPDPQIAIRFENRISTGSAPAVRDSVATQLTNLGRIKLAELSPDGSQIALYSLGELVVMPSQGGESEVLAKSPAGTACYHISWSPDGGNLLAQCYRDSPIPHTAIYLLFDVATKSVRELPHALAGFGTLLPGGEIVSASEVGGKLFFSVPDRETPVHECALPGTYQWILDLDAVGATIYVRVQYANGQRAWLQTDRGCSRPRPVCGGNATPLPDERCLVLWRGKGIWRTPYLLFEVDRDGRRVGDARRVPDDIDDLLGTRRDGAVVVSRRYVSWRLTEYTRAGSRDIASGAGTAPEVALAPDRVRLAITETRLTGLDATHLATMSTFKLKSAVIATGLRRLAWSPDGSKLIARSRSSLALVDVATGSRRDLLVDDMAQNAAPIWLDNRRIAYARADVRGYRSLDIIDGTADTLFDPTKGFTHEAARSTFDGTFAVMWSRLDGAGVWVVPPQAPAWLVEGTTPSTQFEWSADGRVLWIVDSGKIDLYDPASRRRQPFRTLDLPPTTTLTGVWSVDNEHALVEAVNLTNDLWSVDR